ncbi:MAG: hypothetical protein PHT07_14210 [Paludibacter sp.]|nr:hypothetical protein [Paludibacter sp.]
MKKYLLILISAIFIISIFAEKTLNIFKPDLSISNIYLSSIDTLKFSNNNTQLDVYMKDKSVVNVLVSSVDSMTFTDSVSKTLPVVSTLAVTSISYTTALSGYTISSLGGTSILEKGICWSTTANPVTSDNKIVSSTVTSTSSLNLTGLNAGSIIYIRAFATNAGGTAYGNQVTFSTLSYTLPVVETTSASYNYSTNKATCVGKVSSNGGCGTLLERGVCWSTTKNPTIIDSKYPNGFSIGSFYAFMSNLNLNSTYYVRAYATNCIGTAYGAQLVVKPLMGNVTYTMGFDSLTYPEPYRLIKIAVDSACLYYNRYTTFSHNIWIAYSPGVPTAEASYHGQVAFGSNTTYMWVGTAMHEFAHYFGSGTTTVWQGKLVSNVWQGSVAAALLLSATGETLKGDSQHFWPYGINYKSEITALGGQTAQENGLALHAKLAKAMIVDDCRLPVSW